jgi:hypothetical protein
MIGCRVIQLLRTLARYCRRRYGKIVANDREMLKEGVFSFEVQGAQLKNRSQSHGRLNGLAFPHNIHTV